MQRPMAIGLLLCGSLVGTNSECADGKTLAAGFAAVHLGEELKVLRSRSAGRLTELGGEGCYEAELGLYSGDPWTSIPAGTRVMLSFERGSPEATVVKIQVLLDPATDAGVLREVLLATGAMRPQLVDDKLLWDFGRDSLTVRAGPSAMSVVLSRDDELQSC